VEETKESQEEKNRKGQEEVGEGNSKGKVKEKEVLDLSGDSSKSHPNQALKNPKMSEEERQDSSESDSDFELTQPMNNNNPRRKSHRNKRESMTNREKELGIQKKIEETLNKDGKYGKNKAAQHKGIDP
jgi:hypothetical protein